MSFKKSYNQGLFKTLENSKRLNSSLSNSLCKNSITFIKHLYLYYRVNYRFSILPLKKKKMKFPRLAKYCRILCHSFKGGGVVGGRGGFFSFGKYYREYINDTRLLQITMYGIETNILNGSFFKMDFEG